MLIRKLCAALTLLAALGAASPAAANDAVFGGAGADVAPVKEDRLRMVSEDILIELVGKKDGWRGEHWEITAKYVFENPTSEDVSTTFGFPERLCQSEGNCNTKEGDEVTFHGMKTTVGGKPARVRVGKVSSESEWAPELGRVHLFEVKLPAKKKVEVVHRYQMGISGSFMQETELFYVTKTGALWAGPIERARFTIRTPHRPWGFSFPKNFSLERFDSQLVEGKARTEIVFSMKDWTPTQDLRVILGSDYAQYDKCPSMVMFIDNVYFDEEFDLDQAKKELAELDDAQLRVCRNLAFAHHGYTFKDKKLNARFYHMRAPTSAAKARKHWMFTDMIAQKAEHRVVLHAPNPHYSPKMLTPRERKWVRAFKAVEKARAGEKKKKKKR